MSHFFVNTDRIRETEDSLGSIPGKMQGYSDEVKSVRSSLDSSFSERVFATLGNISESLIDKAARMDSFKSALALINEEYIKTENLLTGKYDVINASGDSYGTDKRSWWDQFWDWVFNKDIDREYTNTTKEQEDAADREMQDAIQSILDNDERFSEDYWKNASLDERKQILTDYMNQVKAVMGLSSLPATITWTNTTPDANGIINLGGFSQYADGSNKHIEMNEYILRTYSPEESYEFMMTTIVHELRHGYQHAAVENPTEYRVSQETIDAWEESFRTYAAEKAKGHQAYLNIVVEKDARWFSKQTY